MHDVENVPGTIFQFRWIKCLEQILPQVFSIGGKNHDALLPSVRSHNLSGRAYVDVAGRIEFTGPLSRPTDGSDVDAILVENPDVLFPKLDGVYVAIRIYRDTSDTGKHILRLSLLPADL